MILLSIILCLYANLIRWADLADNGIIITFKDYINYQNKIVIAYNVCWFLITGFVWFFLNIERVLNN